MVGAVVESKRVLIIDDVITSGLAITKSIDLLWKHKAIVVGICVALDRQKQKQEQFRRLKKETNLEVHCEGNLDGLVAFIESDIGGGFCSGELQKQMKEYRNHYGTTTAADEGY